MNSEIKAANRHSDTKKHKIKSVIKNVLYNSFAQALYKLFTTNHFILKAFLLTFVLASSCLASYMVISEITNYFNYGVVTTTRTLNEIPSKFPQITFCNYNMFTTEYALEFLRNMSESMKKSENAVNIFDKNEIVNVSHKDMVPKVSALYKRAISHVNSDSFSDENRKKLGHRLKDILHNCKFNTLSCNLDEFTWEFDPVYGNCYKFNAGQSNSTGEIKESTIAGPLNGLKFDLFVNVHEDIKDYYYSYLIIEITSSNFNALGAIIKIDNSSYSTDYSYNGGIKIASGFHTDLSIYRKFSFNLPKPYSRCELDNDNINLPISKSDNTLLYHYANSAFQYTQQSCILQCMQLNIINLCNCSHPSFLSIHRVNKCQSLQKEIPCAQQAWQKYFTSENFRNGSKRNLYLNRINNCIRSCPLECNQTHFETKLSSMKTISWKFYLGLIEKYLSSGFLKLPISPETATESFVSLSIFYESLSYTYTTESPQIDWISLLGSIGGNLSLVLGVSIFSLCELVEVLIEIYFIEKK
jgi:hypothetical protein